MLKTKFEVHINKFMFTSTWKNLWNETDDEILSVLAEFLRTLKFVFLNFYGKFLVLIQAIIFRLSF